MEVAGAIERIEAELELELHVPPEILATLGPVHVIDLLIADPIPREVQRRWFEELGMPAENLTWALEELDAGKLDPPASDADRPVKEVASVLGIAPATVYVHLSQGQTPQEATGGSTCVISRNDCACSIKPRHPRCGAMPRADRWSIEPSSRLSRRR
jgi:hypothetical protein